MATATCKKSFERSGPQRPQRGAQAITLHGKPSAVVISFDEYNKAMNVRKPGEPLSSFFHNSPLRNSGIELKRSKDSGRNEVIL